MDPRKNRVFCLLGAVPFVITMVIDFREPEVTVPGAEAGEPP